MVIKKGVKIILSRSLRRKIDNHKISSSNLSTEEARRRIEAVYTNSRYEMNGVISEGEGYALSLIVPVYNSEAFLRECIDSLINQKTKYKYEIILINDGSKDDSGKILKEYRGLDNVVIVSQENQGISKTRNKGIELSRGKYIGFIDNDDKVSEKYVERLMDAALKNGADIVKCGCVEFDSDSQKLLHDFSNHGDFSIARPLGDDLFRFDGFIWGGCYKKSFWGKTQFPDGYWYEDMITRWILYRKANSFEYIGETLYYKREHASNSAKKIWNSKSIKSLDQLYLVQEIIRLSDEANLKKDKVFFRLLISEYGFMLGHRTASLDESIREAAFVLASDTVCSFPKEYDYDDAFCVSLRNRDYQLWKMLSKYRELVY